MKYLQYHIQIQVNFVSNLHLLFNYYFFHKRKYMYKQQFFLNTHNILFFVRIQSKYLRMEKSYSIHQFQELQ